jgi:pantoate--beta-alanine ligase
MKSFSTISDLKAEISRLIALKKSVGFVPTMGALHRGHLTLVERAKQQNDVVVVSIFVNPTQFNDKNDLSRYPRTPEQDLQMLEAAGVDLVFVPEVLEIYPEGEMEEKFEFGNLEQLMEGAHRPGHFQGVARVVAKLFRIVCPERAYFGEKDFQQLAIIKELTGKFFPKIDIIPCPTVREYDGLAMSSRNAFLDNETRKEAALISQTLFQVQNSKNDLSIAELKKLVEEKINASRFLKLEYFEIADENSLHPVSEISTTKTVRAFIAVKAGAVRLIDNISLNS